VPPVPPVPLVPLVPLATPEEIRQASWRIDLRGATDVG
jgi:hypothetical protein